MQNDMMKQWSELNQASMNSIKELTEINAKAMGRLTEKQMEMVNYYMESGSKHLGSINDIKSVQDVVTVQTRMFSEINEKMLENARQTMELLSDLRSDLTAWVEKGMESAMANVKDIDKK